MELMELMELMKLMELIKYNNIIIYNKMKKSRAILYIIILLVVILINRIFSSDVIIEGMEVSLPTSISGPPEAIKLDENKEDGGKKDTCQPCPPCGRCPEPSFECKKVPTYSNINNLENVPMVPEPVRPDYTTFGI